ncbi:MAG: nucleotidyltransferase [Promethearchaeota archaeon]
MTSIKRTLLDIIHLVVDYLEDKGVDYVIVGGIAVIAWGRPRTTQDIDLIVDHQQLDVKDFANFLRNNDFFADEEDLQMAFSEHSHATILDKKSLIRIDLVGVYSTDQRNTLKHRQTQVLGDKTIYIDSPESLIAHKLLFGSEQDFQDALAVYTRNEENLNFVRLTTLISNLKVEDDFKKLKKELRNFHSDS